MPPLITRDEALALSALSAPQAVEALVDRAWRVRVARFQDATDLCATGSGCATCSDRGSTSAPPAQVLADARAAEEAGAHRYCVSAGFDQVLEGVRLVAEGTNLKRCAAVVGLTAPQARMLRAAGVQRVHGDLETAAVVRSAGLETCVRVSLTGSAERRVDAAFALSDAEPTSVSIESEDPPGETAKWVAIFRLILPGTLLRLAGDPAPEAVRAGLNGVTLASADDRSMFEQVGLNAARQPDNGSRPRPDNRSGWMQGETPDVIGDYLAEARPADGLRIRLWEPATRFEFRAQRLAPAVERDVGLSDAA